MLNDYAGVQNNLKGHSDPTYGDESILKQIADYNEITGRTLLSEKTTPAQMKEKLAEGVMLNLNTMLAAVMYVHYSFQFLYSFRPGHGTSEA